MHQLAPCSEVYAWWTMQTFHKKKLLLHFFISIGAYTLLALHAALMPPETTYEHIATHIPTLREHNYTWQRLQFAEWLPTLCCSLIVSKRAMLDDLRQKCCRAFWNCEARVLCAVCRSLVLMPGWGRDVKTGSRWISNSNSYSMHMACTYIWFGLGCPRANMIFLCAAFMMLVRMKQQSISSESHSNRRNSPRLNNFTQQELYQVCVKIVCRFVMEWICPL